MKIALFSPFSSQNYGTVLQAFALSKVIKELGADCEYIRWHHCESTFLKKAWFLLRHPSYYFLRLENKEKNKRALKYSHLITAEYAPILEKNKKFVDCYTPISQREYTYDNLNSLKKKFEKFLVGSDQTWNPDHIYQFSPYYLRFVNDNLKKYAYGCSMGRNWFSDKFLSFLKTELVHFSSLSCRDKENAEMLTKLIGRKVYNVVDPTLLLNRTVWKNYMKPVNNLPEKYILCYILGEKKSISNYAEFLGKKRGLPVYYILTRPAHAHHEHVLKGVGVQEFLWLIDNCQYLVTDSFHGTIFAINFGKEMISFDKFEGTSFDNGRIHSVLSIYGLSTHYMNTYEEHIPETIDYSKVFSILENNRQESLCYLKRIILE